MTYDTIRVVVSDSLPTWPSFAEDIARRVRHGLADVLEWLDEPVGPEPGQPCHSYMSLDPGTGEAILFVSQSQYDAFKAYAAELVPTMRFVP